MRCTDIALLDEWLQRGVSRHDAEEIFGLSGRGEHARTDLPLAGVGHTTPSAS